MELEEKKDTLVPGGMYYKQMGNTDSTRTMVFIHGATMTGAGMELIAMQFLEYRCILVDLPGHGGSRGRPKENVEDMAEEVIGFLDMLWQRQEITDDVFLVGYSMGGAVSIECALKKRDYIKGMVIVSSGADLAGHTPLISEAVKKSVDCFDSGEFFSHGFGSGTLPEERAVLMEALNTTKVKDAIGYCDLLACSRYNRSDRAAEINVPVLIISGDEDEIVLPGCSFALKEALPNSSLAVLPFRGHTAVYEMLEYVTGVMKFFMNRH